MLKLLLKIILLRCVWWHSILATKRSKLRLDIEFADEGVAGFDEDDEFGCCDIQIRYLKKASFGCWDIFVCDIIKNRKW